MNKIQTLARDYFLEHPFKSLNIILASPYNLALFLALFEATRDIPKEVEDYIIKMLDVSNS